MPPRKPAATPAENPNELILQYLQIQNRPYSAVDISSNLHNKVTKTRTDKVLKEMLERGEIGGTSSGKQWVFWCLQDAKDAATPAELAALDASIATIRDRLPTVKAELKTKCASLATLRSAPTTSVLRESVEELQKRKEDVETRLKALRGGDVKPVSKDEKETVEKEFKKWEFKRNQRKKWFLELEGMLLDAGMGKEDIWDKCCIDDDP